MYNALSAAMAVKPYPFVLRSETSTDRDERMKVVCERSLFRRRLSAEGAKPESSKRWKTGSGHVCLYVCMHVFSRISHDLEHLANPKWCHVVAP